MSQFLLSQPADDDKELEQQQSQVLLLRLQAVRGFLDALQQLVAQNLQDVVWEERQHRGNLLWPGDTEERRKSCLYTRLRGLMCTWTHVAFYHDKRSVFNVFNITNVTENRKW